MKPAGFHQYATMIHRTLHARPGSCRLLGAPAGAVAVALALALPASAQVEIPVFETKYELRYEFPEDRSDVLPTAFRSSITGTERIRRDQRETVMQYDGALGFTLAARPLSSSVSLPEGSVDLFVRLTDIDMRCRAGRGSYSILADQEGLRVTRPTTGEAAFGPHDQYSGSHTVSSLLAKLGTLRFFNGALLAAPTEPAMLTALDCLWMYTGITSILPPLPAKAIAPGQTWKAGMPVRLSVFGQPQIIRFDLRFEEYDENTHVASVSWKTTLTNTSVLPAPGIHHLGQDAVASGTISGRVRLHVDTGFVLDSELRLDLNLSHVRSSKTTVRYQKVYTLENLDLPEPEASSVAAAGPDPRDGEQ